MAKKTILSITDDLDGSADATTVSFGLETKLYEIDLSPLNQRKLEEVLAPFIESARPAKTLGSKSSARTRTRTRARSDLSAIRAWARDSGLAINERGRVPASIIDAYTAAHL
jgi:hypothetical protein